MILILVAVGLGFTTCRSIPTQKAIVNENQIISMLENGYFEEAQVAYSDRDTISIEDSKVSALYKQYFEVVSLYDYPYEQWPDTLYRYASCADLSHYGEQVVEWRSIAASGNPMKLSKKKIVQVQTVLAELGLWRHEVDGIASKRLQKAIQYYRLTNGMNVECALYPYNLMLKSTYCRFFEDDVRCQPKYDF